jgi:hypothetical protein
MPVELNSIDELNSYLTRVIDRARHHAHEIQDIILTLAGAVILEKDRGEPLSAGSYRGNVANVLRATIRRQQYVFSYNHDEQRVDIKRGNARGEIVGSFDNHDSAREVARLFGQL